MKKIVTMGEIMMRLSTINNERFIQADKYNACYGGSEANVAVSLACFGMDAKFVTKLPDNPIGRAAQSAVRKYGVDTSAIAWGGQRVGIYYLEQGAAQRSSQVVYDRAGSSMSQASFDDWNWDDVFLDADWLHISGITPAISQQATQVTLEAVKVAYNKGLTVSCDLNYRAKLWTVEQARAVMPEIMKYVDVCIGGREDATKMLGFKLSKHNDDDTPNLEAYKQMFEEMVEQYGFKYVACSMRRSFTASDNELGGLIYDGQKLYKSPRYRMNPMIDRVGGGDAFAAGIIYSILEGKTTQDVVNFAVAASVLKHSIPGDFNLSTKEEVEALMNGNSLGRVSR